MLRRDVLGVGFVFEEEGKDTSSSPQCPCYLSGFLLPSTLSLGSWGCEFTTKRLNPSAFALKYILG